MPIREVVKAFNEYIDDIPSRFIDLSTKHIRLIERDAVKQQHVAIIESITEADIEQHTSYANQHREDVIKNIVRDVVKYAVLSHTRREGFDFGYQEMTSPDSIRDGPGWGKLIHFTQLARLKFHCQYAWVNTACIDPDKPEEQQAAARSCFDWTRNAHVCIVYLANTLSLSELQHDVWFRRGWRLPELLAAIRIKFYGAGWEPLNVRCPIAENDKADWDFLDALSKASGISINDLRTFLPGPNRVREKLTWASKRETATVEERTYSLISIFGSRMGIDPGESDNAFLRLMLRIIPRSRECDVFAWAGQSSKGHPAIPSSPARYGTEHRDREFHPNPHRYRLRGDRSFLIGYDHLKIKVIFVDVILRRDWMARYTIQPCFHKASIGKVVPLSKVSAGALMAVGVIDYDWTDAPGQGELRGGEGYFGFLLQRSSKEAKSQKVDTEKVVFLDNKETKRYDLQVLHLMC